MYLTLRVLVIWEIVTFFLIFPLICVYTSSVVGLPLSVICETPWSVRLWIAALDGLVRNIAILMTKILTNARPWPTIMLGNEDEYDYAIELLPDEEYRRSARILSNISDLKMQKST